MPIPNSGISTDPSTPLMLTASARDGPKVGEISMGLGLMGLGNLEKSLDSINTIFTLFTLQIYR